MQSKSTYEELEKKLKQLEQELEKRLDADRCLLESEIRFSQIIQGTPIPTFVIDDRHVVTHWNRACENLTGLSAEKIIGTRKQWMAFYGSERPVMADLLVDEASEETIARYYETRYRPSAVIKGAYEAEGFFPDFGSRGKWLFFTASPLKNGDGKITGAIETLQDITEQKRAEEVIRESGKRYRNFLDLAPYPISVFTMDGYVSYLNPAFTLVFGWTLDELQGKRIPFLPRKLREENRERFLKLMQDRVLLRYESKRLTKDGRVLDIVMRAAIYSESEDNPAEILLILRDVTLEKRIARNNEAVLRLSTALPEYPELDELLNYVSNEIKQLLGTEGGLIVLLDEEKQELFFRGISYDSMAIEKRIKEMRFSLDEVMAGGVIRSGEPVIVNDASKESHRFPDRDKKLGYKTRNYLEVPLRSGDRIIGVLAAINKHEGRFDQMDVELLTMISTTVSLSIENARYSDELKKAYKEVTSLNRAKDRVINHLSHELKTPLSVLTGSMNILSRQLKKTVSTDTNDWKRTLERSRRNLARIIEIHNEVEDIMQAKENRHYTFTCQLLDQCTDLLEVMLEESSGEMNVVNNENLIPIKDSIRKRIDELFASHETEPKLIRLGDFISERLNALKKLHSHRKIILTHRIDPALSVKMPLVPLQKTIDGIYRNAVENTPDEGKIDVIVQRQNGGSEVRIYDYGVGITPEGQRRIFDGFYTTRDPMAYSSKRPFDFHAGGKGADLLRIKIFSERYCFKIRMNSKRCQFIPKERDICPGVISECSHCKSAEDCYRSGGTCFSLFFPSAMEPECLL